MMNILIYWQIPEAHGSPLGADEIPQHELKNESIDARVVSMRGSNKKIIIEKK